MSGEAALRCYRAQQQTSDREHEHERLKNVKIVGIAANVEGCSNKAKLNKEKSRCNGCIAFPHSDPNNRQKQRIENMVLFDFGAADEYCEGQAASEKEDDPADNCVA